MVITPPPPDNQMLPCLPCLSNHTAIIPGILVVKQNLNTMW